MQSKSTPRKQQEFERHDFGMFQKIYPLPDGAVTHGDKPDVIINGDRKIGIEVTNFYRVDGGHPDSEQVQRIRRALAISRGQRLYEGATGINFQLTFSFDKRHPLQDAEQLAKRLVEVAHRVEGWKNGQIRRDVYRDIPELDFVYLYARELVYPSDYFDPEFPNGAPDASEGFEAYKTYHNRREAEALRQGVYRPLTYPGKWNVAQGHDFGLMSVPRLTEIVREKELKARKYTPCDAYWLLVIVNFIDAAQEQEIRLNAPIDICSDVFERIIVYKPYFEHIVEIPQPSNAQV